MRRTVNWCACIEFPPQNLALLRPKFFILHIHKKKLKKKSIFLYKKDKKTQISTKENPNFNIEELIKKTLNISPFDTEGTRSR